MKALLVRFALLWLCALAACGSVPKAPTPSPYFETVSARLHLGGTVFAYADIDGDAERATEFVLSLLRDVPELGPRPESAGLNAKTLTRALGLDAVKAIGVSSYRSGDLYRNQSFIHHVGPRQGALKLFGEGPASFGVLALAPPEADLIWQQRLDVGALVQLMRALSELGLGMTPEELDRELGARVLGLDVTLGEAVRELETNIGLVVVTDASRNLWLPGESVTFPYMDVLLYADGLHALGDALVKRAAADPFLRTTRTKDLIVISTGLRFPPPWNVYEPAVIKELATGRLYLVSSTAFLERCATTDASLASTDDFVRAFEGLPTTGNGLIYLSPDATRQMHSVLDQFVASGSSSVATTIARALLPDSGAPVGWVLRNEEDGILLSSNTASSHKSTLLTLGLAAALPALVVLGTEGNGAAPDEEPFEPPFQ